ncbi:MAG: hypothetical protein AVDCRST_MAG12-2699, partial [uncultured Rubrobacteraceae bacterium]
DATGPGSRIGPWTCSPGVREDVRLAKAGPRRSSSPNRV